MSLPEQVKHTIDAVTIPTGVLASIGWFFEAIINPVLAGLVLITSLIWGIYRIKDMKKNRGK